MKQYFILHYAIDNFGPPVTVFKTNTFDQQLLQKTFDKFAVKMGVGDLLEYGKSDNKYIYPSMMEVEMTSEGLVRFTPKGRKVKYIPKSER